MPLARDLNKFTLAWYYAGKQNRGTQKLGVLEDVSIEPEIEFWLFQCCHIAGWVRRGTRPCIVCLLTEIIHFFTWGSLVGFFSITLSSYESTDNPADVSCEDI